MSKTSGSIRSKTGGIGRDGGGNFDGSISNIGSLKEIIDVKLRRAIQQGISKFQARIGIGTTNVRLADIEGAYGVHRTQYGKSEGVYLARKVFKNAKSEDIIKSKNQAYKAKFLNRTNKQTQHTVVHELSHSVWNQYLKGEKYLTAGKQINTLYRKFLKDKPKTWGSYSKSNVNEFFAEGVTQGVIGKEDIYTKQLIKIIKDNKL